MKHLNPMVHLFGAILILLVNAPRQTKQETTAAHLLAKTSDGPIRLHQSNSHTHSQSIDGHTHIQTHQTFVNQYKDTYDASYQLQLPPDAWVTGLELIRQGRRIRTSIDHDAATESGKTMQPFQFNLSAIQPGEVVEIIIHYAIRTQRKPSCLPLISPIAGVSLPSGIPALG